MLVLRYRFSKSWETANCHCQGYCQCHKPSPGKLLSSIPDFGQSIQVLFWCCVANLNWSHVQFSLGQSLALTWVLAEWKVTHYYFIHISKEGSISLFFFSRGADKLDTFPIYLQITWGRLLNYLNHIYAEINIFTRHLYSPQIDLFHEPFSVSILSINLVYFSWWMNCTYRTFSAISREEDVQLIALCTV